MKRVTADSNQYISALLRGGKPLQLLELARSGQIELAVSDDVLNEVGRVLRDKHAGPQLYREASCCSAARRILIDQAPSTLGEKEESKRSRRRSQRAASG